MCADVTVVIISGVLELDGVLPRRQGDERRGVSMDFQAQFVGFLRIRHHKRVISVGPGNGCV